MNKDILQIRQNYPLWMKIEITKNRIRQWVDMYGEDMVYVSFSGGKDSTVLLHLVRSIYPNVKAVFANTGNEFPEIVQFVRNIEGVTWVRPRKSFAKILKEEGYPVLSKKSARMIRDLQNPTDKNQRTRELYMSDYRFDKEGNLTDKPNKALKLAKRHRYLIDSDIKISEKCCHYLKKLPMKDFERNNKSVKIKKSDEQLKPMPIVGTQADEGQMREAAYLKNGCNAWNSSEPKSSPLSFWTQQDILEYIDTYNIEIASIYGEIKKDENGEYYTTGESRTGCVACGYGVHLETDTDNRYLRLEESHPKLHNHIINNLGFGDILNIMNIRYSKKQCIKVNDKLGGIKVKQYKWDL